MAEEILDFIVMVNGGGTESEVLRAVTNRIPEATGVWEDTCRLRGNRIEVWSNEEADPSMAADDDDGYLYFPWRVEVTPEDNGMTEQVQTGFAGEVLGAYRDQGWDAVLVATFEDNVE